MTEIENAGTGRVIVVGHRGAMGHAPENTLPSFRKGRELGADTIELDVRLSGDGQIVVIHDSKVDRTTSGTGEVASLTAKELGRLNAGSSFSPKYRKARIPTLEQILRWSRRRTQLVIEIKGDPEPQNGIEEKLVKLLRRFRMVNKVMVISFHHPSVKRIKELETELATGILFSGRLTNAVGAARENHADSVRPVWSYWSGDLVEEVHREGLQASAWTVDEPKTMKALIRMGIDSIATNYPDRLRRVIEGSKGKK